MTQGGLGAGQTGNSWLYIKRLIIVVKGAGKRSRSLIDMGNATSQAELEYVGYRVLGVQPNSPAAEGGACM